MLSPRWKKILRDLQAARGRMVMVVIAIAVSIFAVGTILTAYTILTREVSRNYLGTNPASAFLELDRVDDSVVEAVKQQPNIVDAEAGSWVMARVEIQPNEWRPLLLFVVKDFDALRISKFLPEAGSWPPPAQTILLEREALKFINANVGDVIPVQLPNGKKQALAISGSTHDAGLAPAWQEEMAYGYVTPETLAWLGEGDTLHILKVIVKDQSQGRATVEATVSSLAQWLKGQGRTVGEIRIPPPLLHPHQSQMNSVLLTLLIFSLMALVLSAILTATIISGMLAQQIRQIGIMKAIGARSIQITSLYLVLIVFEGLAAVAIGLPLGVLVGRAFTRVVAEVLNLTLYSESIPAWVFLVELLMGTLVPLLVALGPIQRTTRVTVRETLNDYGMTRESFGARGLDAWLGKIRGIDNTLMLALRNTFRRRGRLILTLGLLAAGGGMFMTGINVNAAWDDFLVQATATRHYDIEIRLNSPQPEEKVLAIITSIPKVQQVEPWNLTPVAVSRPDGLEIVHTYPDGGHGSLTLRSVPPESKFIESLILSGRWLQADDTDGAVLNHMAATFFPNVKVGDTIRLTIDDRAVALRVVGIVRQNLTPAAVYVTSNTFAQAAGLPAQSINGVRIRLKEHDDNTVRTATGEIERALAAENISLKVVISETMVEGATSGHVYIFIFALIMMALVMAVVGALGLMSSMGTSVIERTREFGVMRAIGAKSRTVLRNVISEGIFIGLMSWGIAIVISLPLSFVIGYLIGSNSFFAPLSLVVSPIALVIWLGVIVIGSIAASAYPAWQASRLTIRETLAYV
ncbi:MAG: ABC transporter permease [Chloroflexi bacterium]|nr:ABC transporter permease [Chloroflexota bacterium]